MMKKKHIILIAVILLLVLGVLGGAVALRVAHNNSGNTASANTHNQTDTPAPAQAIATGCDESLWAHVYNPSRLTVIAKCVTVTGTIDESSTNTDGDAHFTLNVDAPYASMINAVNKSDKNGDLVVEAVCAIRPSDKKVGDACGGFQSNITIPSVGDRVKVTGTFVDDTHNGWNEIHPVTLITKL